MNSDRARATLLAALLAGPLPVQAQSTDRPVVIGDGPTVDACASVGAVTGLDPDGANRLSVRAGPGQGFRRIDSVGSGNLLWLCGQDGDWFAVVYETAGEDCGVFTPVDPARPYAGPCRSGWVSAAFVTPVAG